MQARHHKSLFADTRGLGLPQSTKPTTNHNQQVRRNALMFSHVHMHLGMVPAPQYRRVSLF
jgi:hypothetical protein